MAKADITINLHQFEGYDYEAFKEYLTQHMPKYKQWKLALPQPLWSPRHANDQLVYQYLIAMYLGEVLTELCFTLGYSVPSPWKAGEFTFTVKIKRRKIPEIAELLALIATNYLAEEPSPEWIYFVEKAIQFFKSTDSPKGPAPVCSGLLMVCEQFCEHTSE